MSYITNAADAAGADLPLAGGTMTGAISLANVAATLTGGGSTATWTPSALSYTYTIQQAAGSTGVTWNYTNSYTSGNLFIINDNTGSAARSMLTLTVVAAGQPNLQWSRTGTVEGSISIGTTYGFEIGIVSGGGNRNITRLYGGTSTTANGGGIRIDAGNGAGASGVGGAIVEITGNGAGSGNGGAWTVTGGQAGATGTGANMQITSGAGGGTSGASGVLFLYTGTTTEGNTGKIELLTGNAAGVSARNSGVINIQTGTPSTTGASGNITMQTGVGGSVSGASGTWSAQTGTTTSGASGSLSLSSGNATAGNSGTISFTTGTTTTSGTTGAINFTTGASVAASGGFTFTVGSAGTTAGAFAISGASNIGLTSGGVLTLTSTDAGAGGGPDLTLYRNSASAAASDVMGRILFDGNSATPTQRTMGVIQSVLVTATDGAEDAKIEFYTIAGGASNLAVWFAETGQIHADLGAGTGNVTVFDDHDDVQLIRSYYNRDMDRAERERAMEHLGSLGLVSRKQGGSGWAFALQDWLGLLGGGIHQTERRVADLEAENSMLRARLTALEARCQ